MAAHKTIIKLFHFDLHLEHKSCSLPPLVWKMERFKTSAYTYTHIPKFVLADFSEVLFSFKYLRNH